MRRALITGVLGLGGLAVLAPPASATFHLEMVNEVMLASSSGNPGVQFVELLDHGGTEEAFTPVFAPYKLVVYDPAGNELGEHMLDPTGLRNAAAMDTEYLISTPAADAAFGVTGNERLDVSLPPSAGQVCFDANPNPPAFSCMTYGSISKTVPTNSQGTGSVHGPVPPNGESDQRQPDNSVQAAPPTPKARNRAGTGTTPGGGSTSTPGASSTAPSTSGSSGTQFGGAGFSSGRARLGRRGRVDVRLSCSGDASGSCTGTVTLVSLHGHHTLGRSSLRLERGTSGVIRVKLSRRALRRLRRRGRLLATATVTVQDATGRSRTSTARLTLVAR